MRNFNTQRVQRGATGRMPVQLNERESRPVRRPQLRIFAISALAVEDGEAAHHYADFKAGYDLDQAYRDAMSECYRSFPLSDGFDGHSVEIVEIPHVHLEA